MQILEKNKLHGLAKDLTNRVFGKWKVIKYSGSARTGGTVWLCECACGSLKQIPSWSLVSGLSKTCGCSRKGKNNHNWKGYKEISGNRWNDIIQNAKARNLVLEITIKDIYDLFKEQQGLCALTGIELKLGEGSNRGNASLDRIDSDKGYINGNVQWIHKDINRMKNSFSQEYFIKMCKLVAK